MKEYLETGKKRQAGDAAREANSDEVTALRSESAHFKEELAETLLEIRLLKKVATGLAATIREICGLKKTRYHRSLRELPAAGTAGARSARYPEIAVSKVGTNALVKAATMPWRTVSHAASGVWNRIPDTACEAILDLALEKTELSAQRIAVRYAEKNTFFV